MGIINKAKFALVLLFVIASMSLVFAQTFSSSSPQLFSPGSNSFSYLQGQGVNAFPQFNEGMCEAGQDFILQIDPLGCQPSVVRSDLLEEQNVPIFCPIVATKINPLIDVNVIDSIVFRGDFPSDVAGIGFHPARAAINPSRGTLVNSPILENIGYAVIVLRQNQNESSMPESVSGNLIADIRYDVENAFGTGKSTFYLPVLDDNEWQNNHAQYGFWNGKGFLRTELIEGDRASISIYLDEENAISTFNLQEGETSGLVYLPGHYCQAGLSVRLDGLESPDTRAKLNINGEIFEVEEDNRFLENKCVVTDLEKIGINQMASISCNTDTGVERFDLRITPGVELEINGVVGTYRLGDRLPFSDDPNKNVYLGFVGTQGNSLNEEDAYVRFIKSPRNEYDQSFLTENMLSEVERYDSLGVTVNEDGSIAAQTGQRIIQGLNSVGDWIERFTRYLVRGTEISNRLEVQENNEVYGASVTLLGLNTPENQDISGARCYGGSGEFDASRCEIGDSVGEYTKYGVNSWTDYDFINLRTTPFGPGFSIPAGSSTLTDEGIDELVVSENGEISLNINEREYSNFQEYTASSGVAQEVGRKANLFNQYQNATDDYERIIQSYPNEVENEITGSTFGEEALSNLIRLAASLGQMETVSSLCQDLEENHPESFVDICGDKLRLSSSESSEESIVINGNTKVISFQGVYEPSLSEYSVEIAISNSPQNGTYILGKNDVAHFSENEFIQLREVNNDFALFDVSSVKESQGRELFWKTNSLRINLRDFQVIGENNYQINLNEINLEQVAKVSVLPNVRNTGTQANVSFEVGIEKRAIQLSPDKIKERLEELNESITEWTDVSNKLGDVTEGLNAACLATGATLTIKNFFENLDGKSVSRQDVMRGEGGWTDYCNQQVSQGAYNSLDSCFLEHNDEINKDVEALHSIRESQASINEDNLCSRLGSIREGFGESVDDPRDNSNEAINISSSDFDVAFSDDGRCEQVSLSQARDLERFNLIIESNDVSDNLRESAEIQRYTYVSELKENVDGLAAIRKAQEEAESIGLPGMQVSTPGASRSSIQPASYYGGTVPVGGVFNGAVEAGERIQLISHNDGSAYYVTLNQIGNSYNIDRIFTSDGEEINQTRESTRAAEIKTAFPRFSLIDAQTYNNRFVNPEVKYFETGSYRGLPAVVPFDLQRGWYVSVQQTVPGYNNIRAYDDSGAVGSFWLCNVGPNGMADFNSATLRSGDDSCQQYNPSSGRVYGTFPGLDELATANLVREAMSAVNEASRAYRSGLSGEITINSQRVPVGSPAVNVPDFQCQDFMSPQECNLLFNVCDPVVCPSSRCNLGGEYYVPDVVQSGIVGSTLLCLPNSVALGGDTVVPVCLTGIKAGIDGLNSVQQNYYDCLQENLESGRTIGICDEIHSIYLCDFFWSQAEPLSKVIVPKILGFLTGQGSENSGSSGGGEYLGVRNAWENAQDSAEFFGNYFSQNSFEAFGARATSSAGSSICKNFISATYPTEVDILDPRSPVQYTAWFEEAQHTTATVPPASRYKVFYHIFAGNDISAQYSVYLREPTGTSFYQTNPTFPIQTGFIPAGEYASETVDLVGPSGYRELCVRVNAQEECGFQRVSTSFALDYLQDSYLEEQASQTNINSQAECIAGSPSGHSLINPNLQAGVTDVINPELEKHGIVRVCSTDNPGKSTDPSRWAQVGTCDGGRGEVRCYIDTDSVRDAIQFNSTEGRTLSEIENSQFPILEEGTYLSEAQFSEWIERIENANNPEKIEMINGENLIEKVILNVQKARLHLIRGDAYGNVAKEIYDELRSAESSQVITDEDQEQSTPRQIWTREAAIAELMNREGDYSDNKEFIDQLCEDNILTDEDCDEIEGGFFNIGEENMNYVRNTLEDSSSLNCGECSRDFAGFSILGCSQESCETLDGARVSRGMPGCEFIDGGFFGANQCVVSELTISQGNDNNIFPILPTHNSAKVNGDLNNQQVMSNLDLYSGIISEASNLYGVEESIIKSIILQESTANSDVVGDDGSSFGLMQVSGSALTDVRSNFNDAVVRSINPQNLRSELLDARKNIHVGTAYFALLRNFYVNAGNSNEDAIKLSIVAYNWGRGNVDDACEDNLWVNCENISVDALQYTSNILEFRKNL